MPDREGLRHWAKRLEDLLTGISDGNVTGPGSSTVDHAARWNATDGTVIADSAVSIDGSGNISAGGTVDGVDIAAYVSALGSHLANMSNPHVATQAQVGLSAVTDNSQLKRSADDWAGFTVKSIDGADYLLIEDSADSFNKKRVLVSDLQAVIPPPGDAVFVESLVTAVSAASTGANDATWTDLGSGLTFTADAGDYLVTRFDAIAAYVGTISIVRWNLDGSPVPGSRCVAITSASTTRAHNMVRRFGPLSAGSHTLKVQCRESGPFSVTYGGFLVAKRVTA